MFTEQSGQRVTRERLMRAEVTLDNMRELPAGEGVAFVGLTTSGGSYPTVAQAVYLLTPQDIDVEDTEGAIPTFVPDDGTVPALNLGSQVPPVNTYLIANKAGGSYTFRFDG